MLAGPERPAGAPKRPPEPAANQFGKYTLRRTLGPGVMEATDGKRANTLVLRVLGRTADPKVVSAVCADLKPLAALQHPVIVTYHKLSTVGGGYFTVRDYVQGESVEKSPLEPLASLQVLYEIARAVEFCHERGVVHGGIHPSNIILAPTGHPHLVDVAVPQLRRHFDPGADTPLPDRAADLEALHVLFVALLSGKPYALVSAGERPALRSVHAAVDPALASVTQTSWPAAAQLADEVARILQTLPSDYASNLGLLDRYRLHGRTA
jgi:serine/threonine protein kinase